MVVVTDARGRGVGGGVAHGENGVHSVAGMIVATTACGVCERVFSFDPALVPSIEGRPACQHCIETANADRAAQGITSIPYVSAAYPV